jgi:surfactin synthase thioesterase subunit
MCSPRVLLYPNQWKYVQCSFPAVKCESRKRLAPDILLKGPPIHDLPEAELIQELIRLNGTDKNVLEHTELMRMVLPTLRADLALHEEYRYPAEPALECPMVAFGGLEDIDMKGEALEAWRSHTTGPFSVRMFSGDHFFINSQRSVFLSAFSVELLLPASRTHGTRSALPRSLFRWTPLAQLQCFERQTPSH